jgi:pilus assembly protein FimV
MSILTKIIVVLALWAPVSSSALGIGDITLHSRLNQNLNADILLVISNSENIADIKVNLASQTKFDEIGLPWIPFLSKINFSTKALPNKSLYITLTSKEAVKEPFLHFMLEVKGPKSTLYRQFTLLMEPPEAYYKPRY